MSIDEKYMQRCLQLAALGLANTAPNPMVGAVLVYDGRIIGEGYHEYFGGPHAEVNCINSVMQYDQLHIEKSTLYVSLEPCAHYGKTPPCALLIIDKKIPKVVIGCTDSYEQVNGEGIKILKDAGVNVELNILKEACLNLNKRFFTFHKYKRPYIILKWAQSADDFIAQANGAQTKISNEYTNKLVHKWRSEEAAILVGTKTVITDNPLLTNRFSEGKNPVRVLIDRKLKIKSSSNIYNNEVLTLIFNEIESKTNGLTHFIKTENSSPLLNYILKTLYQYQINSVIIEGGTKTLQHFIDNSLWDEARVITNTTLLLKKGISAPILKECMLNSKINISSDSIAYFEHTNDTL